MPTKLKMYILVPDNVPNNFVPVSCAHAALACYVKFQHVPVLKDWFDHSFKKVVCRVSIDQFEHAKYFYGDAAALIVESDLEHMEVALAIPPQHEWPDFMRKYKLWKPKR